MRRLALLLCLVNRVARLYLAKLGQAFQHARSTLNQKVWVLSLSLKVRPGGLPLPGEEIGRCKGRSRGLGRILDCLPSCWCGGN